MAEWLGKSRIEVEDIEKSIPSIVRYFPMLTRFFVNDQKMRIIHLLDHDEAEQFKKAVTKAYGRFCPSNIQRAAAEALDQWMKTQNG